jgi:hypothetical protein
MIHARHASAEFLFSLLTYARQKIWQLFGTIPWLLVCPTLQINEREGGVLYLKE